MQYKCKQCGISFVDEEDGVCESCSLLHEEVEESTYEEKIVVQKDEYQAGVVNPSVKVRKVLFQDTKEKEPDKTYKEESVSEKQEAKPVSHKNEYLGIVKAYKNEKNPDSHMVRFLGALFSFTQFSFYRDIHRFQLYYDWMGGNQSKKMKQQQKVSDGVIFYGNIMYGHLAENTKVKVKGRRNKNGTIVATAIDNITTGEVIKARQVVSPIMLWAIVLGVIGLIGMFLSNLLSGTNASVASGTNTGSFVDWFLVIILGIIILFGGVKLLIMSGAIWKIIIVVSLLLITRLQPTIGIFAIILLIILWTIKFNIKSMFKK